MSSNSKTVVGPKSAPPILSVQILGGHFKGLIDTSSRYSLAGKHLIQHLELRRQKKTDTPDYDAAAFSPIGSDIIKREEAIITIDWGKGSRLERVIYIPELVTDLILGRDFLRHTHIIVHIAVNGWFYVFNPNKIYRFEPHCSHDGYGKLAPTWELIRLGQQEQEAQRLQEMEWIGSFEETDEVLDQNVREESEDESGQQSHLTREEDAYRKYRSLATQTDNFQLDENNYSRLMFDITTKDPTILRQKAQALLDQVNHIYDLQDFKLFTDIQRSELNSVIRTCLIKYRLIRRML